MPYSINSNIVYVTPDPVSGTMNIDAILTENSKYNTFQFAKGTYNISIILKIDRVGISFLGTRAEEVHIIQTNAEQDGLVIKSNGFQIKNISIHNVHDGKVALVYAGCNNTNAQDCYVYGNATTFSIFYAGPDIKAGEETLRAYSSGNINSGNNFINNVVYSKWSGDSVSFSLQKNFQFKNNIIRGGKIAIYMCNRGKIVNNIIYDSTSEGIFVSLPSHNLSISRNRIYECTNSGIRVANQLEHGSFVPSKYDISIEQNFIYDTKTNAIEVTDGNNMIINNNKLIGSDSNGLYIVRTHDIKITNNKISYFVIAVILFEVDGSVVMDNNFFSVYPFDCKKIMQLINSNNNKVIDNVIKGNIVEAMFELINSSNNIFDNNVLERFYSKDEEMKIMK